MCIGGPKIPDPQKIPSRQALKLPDGGSASTFTDDDARRRRALGMTAFTGALGLSGGPSTTTALGG